MLRLAGVISLPPQLLSAENPVASATVTPTPTVMRKMAVPLVMSGWGEPVSPSPTATPSPSPTPTPTPTPAPTPDGVRREIRIPILMYHHIAVPPPEADAIRRDLSVSPENFEAQLRYLASNGYHSITLHDLVYFLSIGKPLPPKPVVITFDDGYSDNYTNAYPLLKKYGFVATFFIITDFIDWGYEEYMTWPQIEEMAAAGMEIGSHGRDHKELQNKPLDFLVWQILGSKQTLEAHLKKPVRFFSYPSGRYDRQVMEVLRSAHFWGAVTVEQGMLQTSDDVFRLKRVRVRGSDTVQSLAVKLSLDW